MMFERAATEIQEESLKSLSARFTGTTSAARAPTPTEGIPTRTTQFAAE
jgi:hypothetical protein